jgi:hypothetical protein
MSSENIIRNEFINRLRISLRTNKSDNKNFEFATAELSNPDFSGPGYCV